MSAEAILRHSQKLISNAVAAHRYNTADLTSMNNGSIPVLNEIDPTYHLACMFLRANIPTFLETTRVSLAAAIKNDFATEREFAEIAMSDELANVVVEYRESLSRYVNKLCNISSETLIEAICNDAKTLKYSVLSDIPPSTEAVANLDTTVHVVNAELLEEALNLIRDSEDRLYVAYTERGDFSLAINIVLKVGSFLAGYFSQEDSSNRKENAIGVHPTDFHVCDYNNAKTLTDIPQEHVFPILVFCQSLMDRAVSDPFVEKQFLTSDLCSNVKERRAIGFDWDNQEFINGDLGRKLNQKDRDNHRYFVDFGYENHPAIVQYGKDFICDPKQGLDTALKNQKREFILDQDKLECLAYIYERERLTDHIRAKISEEYRAFGGYDALSAWWRCICSQAMDTIEQMVVHAFLGEKVTGHIEYEEPTYCGTVGFYPPGATAACIKNPYRTWSMGSLTSTELRDPITGKQITRQVYWKADAYQDFLALVSDDRYIPDFLKSFGFATTQSFGYGGNSNIRLTDPTCRLQLPFEYGAQGYSDREKRAYRFSWLYPTRVNSIKQLKKKHNL